MPDIKRKRGSRGGASQRDDALDSPVMKKTRRGNRGKGAQSIQMIDESNPVQLESDKKSYLLSLEECLDSSDQKDPEEMEMIIQNIYSEIDGCELDVATDFETCRVLEKMLVLSNDFQLRAFAEKAKSNANALIRDPYGSHVLQKLLVIAADVVAREDKGESLVELQEDQELETMNDFVVGICQVSWSININTNFRD